MIFFVILSKWIRERSTGKITLLFLVVFMAFTATVLPAQSKKAESYSADVGSVDLRLWYTADEVYEMADAYGESGRQAYIQARLTFDVIWPIVYMLFLTTALSYLFSTSNLADGKFKLINLIPIFSLIFDYIENGLASLIMYKYPVRLPIISSILPGFTFLKWAFIGISFVLVIYGAFIHLNNLIKKNPNSK